MREQTGKIISRDGMGNGIDRGTTDCIKRTGMGNGIDRDGI
jgi:hypothetical protein